MENYTPPERDGENKKRSKTGYNMFFSAYVLQLKQSAAGVPPERGSVARLVGNAWKVRKNIILQYVTRYTMTMELSLHLQLLSNKMYIYISYSFVLRS